MRKILLAFLLCLLAAGPAGALGPHEVALLVNKNSPRSLEAANEFARLRHIPTVNVILLSLPESVTAPEAEISPDDFTKFIWDPARKTIRERRIEDHILAWIYSVDFPVRITSDPAVSLQGLTLVRNKMPDAAAINDGTFLSALFRGPDKQDGPEGEPISLERFTPLLRQSMPLPSMMLGFTGSRGMTMDDVIRNLKYGAISDNTAPKASVYFVLSDDVRSRCREWEFARVQAELKPLGINAVITSNTPEKSVSLMGLQAGTAWPSPAHTGTFLPGALAEHLTSFGAVFHIPDQAVLTEWLRAGATASAGTIAEPMSIWTKFPHARFFTHYATGCTMIESLFMALRSPMQILLVGDPLAKPWGQPMEITLVNLGDENKPATGTVDFMATLWPGLGQPNPELLFLLDGRAVMHSADEAKLSLDTRPLTDGYHELRVVAYARQQVRHQSFGSVGFQVGNRNRACALEGITNRAEVDYTHPFRVSVRPVGDVKEVAVISQERVLAKMSYAPDAALTIDPALLGLGPNELQAVALYAGNEAVRSAPVSINVVRADRAPVIANVERAQDADGHTTWTATSTDPEGDEITTEWFGSLALPEPGEATTEFARVTGGAISKDADARALKADTNMALCLFTSADAPRELDATVSVAPEFPPMRSQVAGLAFNYTDEKNFTFFGLDGKTSAWMLGRYEDGTVKRIAARGAYLEPNTWYRIAVRATKAGGMEALVDGEIVARLEKNELVTGTFGVVSGTTPSRFKEMGISPPLLPKEAFRVEGDVLHVLDDAAAKSCELIVRCRDTSQSSEKSVAMTEGAAAQ